jgi:S1-C subfamily serine protease
VSEHDQPVPEESGPAQPAQPQPPVSGYSPEQPTQPTPTHQPFWGPPQQPPQTAPQTPATPAYSGPSYGSYGSGSYGGGYPGGYGGSGYGGTGYGGYGTAPLGSPADPAAVPPTRRSGRLRIGVAGLVAGAVIGGGAGAGVVTLWDHPAATSASGPAAQSVVIKDPQNATTATAAAAKAAPSVVTIYVTNDSTSGSGSGVVLTDDGYVLTNNHVVTLEGSGTGTVQVRTAEGHLYDATVVGTDPSSDLAVVKLTGASGLTPAAFADSSKVQVGDVAVAIGAPLGLSNTVTDGIISATGRAVSTGSTENDSTVLDAIQTDAAINPGNSGGALVNGAGEVIGINAAIATVASGAPEEGSSQSGNIGVGFAIPSNTAQRIAQQIIKTGKASHAVLGVSARTAANGSNSEIGVGAEVVQVVPGGAAEKAGLQPGDVITAVGSRPISTSTELTAAIRSQPPGGKVTLTISSGSTSKTVTVTLGSGS